MTISRHPGSSADPLPPGGESDSRSSFRSTRPPTVSPADVRSDLGPRSLDPDRSFWSAFAELIRDQTSPTDFCNCISTCGQPNPDSLPSQGRRPRPPSFSDVPRPLPCGSGDTRRAALRPPRQPRCRFFLLSQVCPTAILPEAPHLRAFWARSIVRIDVHGSKDRAKDASPERRRTDFSCLRRVHTLGGVCRRRSPPRRPSDIRCHRRAPSAGRYPRKLADRPRPSFRRRPAKSAAFQKTRMPFTVTSREGVGSRGGIAPPGLRAGSLAHAAHTPSRSPGHSVF
jgi:hypothetical protein